ncbi:MAG TPA: dual specificity protein phosphatase family protein [Bryobacteraceae bacterium]|nr:dual specificity protein phosphatase family protein [Bryobacteraceae bacterium]
MIGTKLYWVTGPWPGKLALAARPRGGEWLEDEMTSWRAAGVDAVVSLLTPEEEKDLGLSNEGAEAKANGVEFISFPILDRQVPDSSSELTRTLDKIDTELTKGKNVLVHCRQGVGRAGLVGACLLLTKGLDAETALRRLSASRGATIPETLEQRRWIDSYASALASAR